MVAVIVCDRNKMSIFDTYGCMKSVLFILNILFVISGVIVLLIGALIKAYYSTYEFFVDDRYLYAPEFLIVLGTVIVLIATLGSYGAITENPCMTLMFSTFLLLVFFIELAIGVSGYVMREKAEAGLTTRFQYAMGLYKNGNPEMMAAWDVMQTNFRCCGVRGPYDWQMKNLTMPVSCCDYPNEEPLYRKEELLLNSPCGDFGLHRNGCLNVFLDFIKSNSSFIQAVGLTLAFLQLLGILCSCYLSYGYRKGYENI